MAGGLTTPLASTKFYQTYKSLLVDALGNMLGTTANPLIVGTTSSAPLQTSAQRLVSLGYSQIADLTAVHKLGDGKAITGSAAVAIPSGALYAVVVPQNGAISFVEGATDGDPTPTLGMPLMPGVSYRVNGADLAGFKCIAMDPGAQLNITFYGPAS